MAKEIGNLNSCDLVAFTQRGIKVYCGWYVGWCAKGVGSLYNAEACLCGAHLVGVCVALVHKLFSVVIVLLFAYTDCGEDNVVLVGGMNVDWVLTRFCCKTEVVRNDGQQCHTITPLGVVDGLEDGVMVGAPLRFAEAGVATKNDPVCNGSN